MYKYNKKLIQHFMHPKNVGKIKNANAIGKAISPVCGDLMKLYLKIKNDKIKDVKFQTLGCAAAIASSSVLTEMIKGKSIKEVKKITKNEIGKKLGGLPPRKVHCSILATDALKIALNNYEKKHEKRRKKKK